MQNAYSVSLERPTVRPESIDSLKDHRRARGLGQVHGQLVRQADDQCAAFVAECFESFYITAHGHLVRARPILVEP